MDNLPDLLNKLIAEACSHPPNSQKRQQALTQVIRVIMRSRKLWSDSAPYYEDALQQTWLYFCRNVCEANTSKRAYDPKLGNAITWLDKYLKRRLQDFYLEVKEQEATIAQPTVKNGTLLDPLAGVAATSSRPPLDILEVVKRWVKEDPTGELRKIHVKGNPKVTCQLLLLRRLPPRQTSWESLSVEFGIPISTLNSFYRRQCFPRLRKFGQSQGYLEN